MRGDDRRLLARTCAAESVSLRFGDRAVVLMYLPAAAAATVASKYWYDWTEQKAVKNWSEAES